MIIDTHFHYLSMKNKDRNATLPEELIGLEVGLNGGDMEKRAKVIGENKSIFLSVGAGPWVLDRETFISIDNELSLLEADIIKFGSDAVGEIGFDNHWQYGTKEAQRELFIRQVDLARLYSLPVVIHSRNADNELLAIAKSGYIDNRTIMHCFSSDSLVCRKLLDKGAYISFAGNVTYKSNSHIAECARLVPLDRILVETDSPYLSPMPRRGEVNNPRNTELTLDFLAKLRNIDKEILKNNIIGNFYALMGRRESIVKRDIATVQ